MNDHATIPAHNRTWWGATCNELEDLRNEVAFWRRQIAATAWGLAAEMRSAKTDEAKAALSIRLRPLLAAFDSADAKNWFEMSCAQCSAPIKPGDRHYVEGDGDDGFIEYCMAHNYKGALPQAIAEGTSEDVARDLAFARAVQKEWCGE